MDRIEEIRARVEAATPGPWSAAVNQSWAMTLDIDAADGQPVGFCQQVRDAIFIAHAREDIPYLLSELEQLRAENRVLHSKLDQCEGRIEGMSEGRSCKTEIPEIICLCGSTRFFKTFDEQNYRLTLEGKIVLSIGCNTKSDEGLNISNAQKEALDELHKRKIDLCDRVFVLNVGGYIGDSTYSEIEYAKALGKPVDFLEDRRCRICGCTDDHACIGGCYWVEEDLCSACVDKERTTHE